MAKLFLQVLIAVWRPGSEIKLDFSGGGGGGGGGGGRDTRAGSFSVSSVHNAQLGPCKLSGGEK